MTTLTSPSAVTPAQSQLSRRARTIEMMDSVERLATQANLSYAFRVWSTLRRTDVHGTGKNHIGNFSKSVIPQADGIFWNADSKTPGMLYLKHPQAVRRALENFLNPNVQTVQGD